MFKNYSLDSLMRASRIKWFSFFVVASAILMLSAFRPLKSEAATYQTGVLRICNAASGSGLENRVFRFKISYLIVEVPVGQCSGLILVPTGSNVIEELSDGRTFSGDTFFGGFELTGVGVLGTTPATAITSVDLALRIANVNVSSSLSETRIEFINSPAETGFLQICKAVSSKALANRIFRFKIGDITVEVVAGQCSRLILVQAGANVIVELADGRTTTGGTFSGGFQLTGVSTLGATPATAISSYSLARRMANVNVDIGSSQNPTTILFTNSAASRL